MNANRARKARLIDMLTYCRPHGSDTETDYRQRFILSKVAGSYVDDYGNIHATVGDSPRVLFSSHTDTVHAEAGRQRVAVDANGYARLHPMELGRNCLGADDTAGCFIMLELIAAGIPGHYIFHYGEERGGIGSSALAEVHAEWLTESFDHAIAFDRRGFGDIITHQGYGRCASDAFATAFAHALNVAGDRLRYQPCDRGIYTDTAEYAELIPECTNVSVGYFDEHTPAECLHIGHVLRLSDALQALDYSTLTVDRDPYAVDLDDLLPWRIVQVDNQRPCVESNRAYRSTACDYLDPEWQEVQETLERMEREARHGQFNLRRFA